MPGSEHAGLSPAIVESIAGLSAGTIATLVVHPLDIVKTRMQSKNPTYFALFGFPIILLILLFPYPLSSCSIKQSTLHLGCLVEILTPTTATSARQSRMMVHGTR